MNYFFFLNREGKLFTQRFLGAAVVASLAEGFMVSKVVSASEIMRNGLVPLMLALQFLLSLLGWFFARKYILDQGAAVVEELVGGLRKRVTQKLSTIEFGDFEKIGETTVVQALAQDCQTLYDTSRDIIMPIAALGFLTSCLIYLALLSPLAFLCVAGASGAFILLQRYSQAVYLQEYGKASAEDRRFFKLLNDQLAGFSELRINRAKAQDFLDRDLKPAVERGSAIKLRIAKEINGSLVLFLLSFYALLGGIAFLLPGFSDQPNFPVAKVISVFVFLTAPLFEIANSFPAFTRASAAVERVLALEEQLSGLKESDADTQPPGVELQSLQCEDLVFRYEALPGEERDAFQVGPVNLKIQRGELIFLIGGNGSGKSTLMRLLCGIYAPTSGCVKINDRLLSKEHHKSYFSIILQNFHLFERLLGHPRIDKKRIDDLLSALRLRGVTNIDEEGHISSTHLSAGQKKRLALLVAECDDRELFMFDEWAADQDPDFRRYFYVEYLTELRDRGKTILAATHDDHYFYLADRVLRLDRGQLTEVDRSLFPAPAVAPR